MFILLKFKFENMDFQATRVVILYQGTRKVSFFPSGLGEKDFLKQSLKLFQIDEEEWENFEIYIEVLSCKLENSNNWL